MIVKTSIKYLVENEHITILVCQIKLLIFYENYILLISPPDGRWLGKQDAIEHYLIVSNLKQEVLDYLLNLCDSHRPYSIFIQYEKGNLMEERTLGSRRSTTEL